MDRATKKLRAKMFSLDIFGEEIGLNVDGNSSFKSFSGLLVSLSILATVLVFGANKFL